MRSPLPAFLADEATVWRADVLACAAGRVLATGFSALDAQLPGGGWPIGAMVEVLQNPDDHLEWRLLLPALARPDADPGAVVLVGPPHVPFGPALAAQGLDPRRLLRVDASVPLERLWATEQALRCAGVSAVLAWLPEARAEPLRRLQRAAAEHAQLLFVMRPASAQAQSSPAMLRLSLTMQAPDAATPPGAVPTHAPWLLHLLKRRGPPLAQPLAMASGPARLAALLAVRAAGAGSENTPMAPLARPVLTHLPPHPQEAADALARMAMAA